MVSCYLNFEHPITTNGSDKFSHAVAIVYLAVALVIMPGAVIFIMYGTKSDLSSKATKRNYGAAYECIKTVNNYVFNHIYVIKDDYIRKIWQFKLIHTYLLGLILFLFRL